MDFNEIAKTPAFNLATNAFGGALNIGSNILLQSRAQRFAASEAEKQRNWSAHQAGIARGFDTPINQMARLRGAGINVNGSDALSSQPVVPEGSSAGSVGVPTGSPFSSDLPNLFGALASMKAADADMLRAKTDAGESPSRISEYESSAQEHQSNAALADATAAAQDEAANKLREETLYQKLVNDNYVDKLMNDIEVSRQEAQAMLRQASASMVAANAAMVQAQEQIRHNQKTEEQAVNELGQRYLEYLQVGEHHSMDTTVKREQMQIQRWQILADAAVRLYTNKEDIDQRDRSLFVNQCRALVSTLITTIGAVKAAKVLKNTQFGQKIFENAKGFIMDNGIVKKLKF